MTYRLFVFILAFAGVMSCNQAQPGFEAREDKDAPILSLTGDTLSRVEKSEEEWKAALSSEAFQVLRKAGTERSFTGQYWDHKEKGVYTCGGCGAPLFDSSTKFKSGTGWPSFYEPIFVGNIVEKMDYKYGMKRVEVLCARCDGHLGHVFPDGPEPTGLRYCINSVSLGFEKKEIEK